MKVLKEVTGLLNREGREDLMQFLFSDHSPEYMEKFEKLFHGLVDNRIKDDDDAAGMLYGTSRTSGVYKTFKHRFKERLLDGLFFLDMEDPKKSASYKRFYRTNKYIHASKILVANGVRKSAVQYLQKAYKLARKGNLTEEEMVAAKHLRRHYSLIGDQKNFKKYKDLFQEALTRYIAEMELEEMWYDLMMEYASSVAFKPELREKADEYYMRALKLAEGQSSFQHQLYVYRIRDIAYQVRQDFERSLKVCTEAQAFCRKHPSFNSNFLQGEMAIKKLHCYLHLQDYENGKKTAEECKQYFPPSSMNRLIFFEYYFMLAMHTGKYQAAKKIFKEATQHPRFPYLPEARHEKWKIFEAYLHYVLESQKDKEEEKPYNIFKFFNEVPVYSKDKKGYNVAILIAQILFFLERDNRDAIITRAEALKVYNNRYLSKELTPRSRYFINMVLTMEAHMFNYDETLAAAEKYRKQMEDHKAHYIGKIESMEVIPYETLWRWILDKLKEQNA